MNRLGIVFVSVIVVLLVFVGVHYMATNNKTDKVLRYGMGSKGWGPLFPAQQSSLYAALIMSHVYDSLVGVDNSGGFTPNLARTWDINEDYTVYTFVFDTTRQFSDGTKLTAQIYKDSLLHSLRLEAGATNKSALDVLYALKGYSEFESTGDIVGLEVDGKEKLRMLFEKPYRGAIAQLSGTRYGAYVIRNSNYIGTGPYVYEKKEDGIVELAANPFYPTPPPIKKVRITTDGIKDLYDGRIDVALGMGRINSPGDSALRIEHEKLSSLLMSHIVVLLNGMNGRVFSDPRLRKAAQYVIYDYFTKKFADMTPLPFFTPDIQFYPQLFPGRLSDDEARRLLDDGRNFVNDLRKASQDSPIECIYKVSSPLNYCDALVEKGVKVVARSSDFASTKSVVYKTFDADIVSLSVSYASADPDGIYHFLGRNGAIWSPLSSRPTVEALIEEGRALIDPESINEHYKRVSRAILKEVPAVHLGSGSLYLEYNADVVEPVNKIAGKRKALNATLFEWR
jgi:ABC-type transport system substrate-binding protein